MTALIRTGHSIDQKNDDVKGCFRPQADVGYRHVQRVSDPSFWAQHLPVSTTILILADVKGCFRDADCQLRVHH